MSVSSSRPARMSVADYHDGDGLFGIDFRWSQRGADWQLSSQVIPAVQSCRIRPSQPRRRCRAFPGELIDRCASGPTSAAAVNAASQRRDCLSVRGNANRLIGRMGSGDVARLTGRLPQGDFDEQVLARILAAVDARCLRRWRSRRPRCVARTGNDGSAGPMPGSTAFLRLGSVGTCRSCG